MIPLTRQHEYSNDSVVLKEKENCSLIKTRLQISDKARKEGQQIHWKFNYVHTFIFNKIFLLKIFIWGGLKPRREICSLPINRGGCKAKLRRFYFDASTETCKLFVFGGCQGRVLIQVLAKIWRTEFVTPIHYWPLFFMYWYNHH